MAQAGVILPLAPVWLQACFGAAPSSFSSRMPWVGDPTARSLEVFSILPFALTTPYFGLEHCAYSYLG